MCVFKIYIFIFVKIYNVKINLDCMSNQVDTYLLANYYLMVNNEYAPPVLSKQYFCFSDISEIILKSDNRKILKH